jgi:xylulokinase
VPLVVGVDSSTQSTKVEVRDADSGGLVGAGRAPHPSTTPPRSEQHPRDWWDALHAARSAALETARHVAGAAPRIDAIAVAAQQHGLVALDGRNEVIRPAKLWNDTESAPDAARLAAQLGGKGACADACGSALVASFTITKLAWLARCEADAFTRLRRVLLPHDWLTFMLSGAAVTDRGDASGTGYWSPREERWRADLLSLVDPERDWAAMLPRVLGPLEAAGTAEGAVVGPGTGDNMAAALGAALRPGDVAVSIGTSGTVFTVANEPVADPSGAVAGFADATGRFLPLVCTLNAAKVVDAFARLLGVDPAQFDALALALAASPGAGGLSLLPYLDGERTPDRPDATGVLRGVRSDVTREQLARAVIEGVVCGLLDGVDALRAAGVVVEGGRLVLLGGGARSAAFQHVLAGLTARPVVVPGAAEQVAAGAAAQAAAVLHGRPADEVAAAWNLDAGSVVDPAPWASTDARDHIRARYARVRDS